MCKYNNQALASLFYHNLFIPIPQTYITYQYHIPISHINITYLYHISILNMQRSLQFFTAARTCHCSQQNVLHDLPQLSAEHSTRPATVFSGTFYTTCHCSQQSILHDLQLFSAERSTRPATLLSRTFYTT
jgi:hypothetical protein